MTSLDRDLLAEKTAAIERHLERVASRLPAGASELRPATDASDAVILHLWQAVQIVIDLALAASIKANLGTPASYGEAFRKLQEAGWIKPELADRLVAAAGFRNLVAHAYERDADVDADHVGVDPAVGGYGSSSSGRSASAAAVAAASPLGFWSTSTPRNPWYPRARRTRTKSASGKCPWPGAKRLESATCT